MAYLQKIQTQESKQNIEIILATQAEDGIRDRSVSRGLGDVYKRQMQKRCEET